MRSLTRSTEESRDIALDLRWAKIKINMAARGKLSADSSGYFSMLQKIIGKQSRVLSIHKIALFGKVVLQTTKSLLDNDESY